MNPDSNQVQAEQDPGQEYSWQASEYIFHEKSGQWFFALIAIAVIIIAILAFLQQWLSIAIIVVMTGALISYSRKEPRTLNYTLDDYGIKVGEKPMPYSQFKSFSVEEQPGWHAIELEPAQRFAPRLTVLSEKDNFEVIEGILADHLPRVDRDPDWIERITRYVRF
jgi:uncharacterized membrane protein YgcG